MGYGLVEGNDALENLKAALQIIHQVETQVTRRPLFKMVQNRLKMDSNTPTFSGKQGKCLDE